MKKTKPLLVFGMSMLILGVIFGAVLITYLHPMTATVKSEGPEDPLEAWSEADYIVWAYNSSHYACRNMSTLLGDRLLSNFTNLAEQTVANCSYGDKVYFKSGTYTVATKWVIETDGVWIQGSGRGTIFKFGDLANNTVSAPWYAVININASEVTLSDFDVDGNYDNNDNPNNDDCITWEGIRVYGSSENVTLRNLHVYDIKNNGVGARGEWVGGIQLVRHFTIENCEVSRMRYMVAPGNGSNCIGAFYADGIRFINNRLHSAREFGIDLYTNTSNAVVTGNMIWNVSQAIGVEGITNCTISNNVCWDIWQGLYISHSTASPINEQDKIIITSNCFTGTDRSDAETYSGIYFNAGIAGQDIYDVTVANNHIEHFGWNTSSKPVANQGGIKAYGDVYRLSISHNTVKDCGDFGIWVSGSNCTIDSNMISSCGLTAGSSKRSAICANGEYHSIRDNDILNCYTGIILLNENNDRFDFITGNKLIDISSTALALNSKNNTVTNNVVINAGTGFETLHGNNYVMYNRFYDCTAVANLWGESDNIIKFNVGYVTENSGIQTVASGENIAHGLVSTPIWGDICSLNCTYDGVPVVVALDYSSWGSTNIVVCAYWTNGTAITDDVILVAWEAKTWY